MLTFDSFQAPTYSFELAATISRPPVRIRTLEFRIGRFNRFSQRAEAPRLANFGALHGKGPNTFSLTQGGSTIRDVLTATPTVVDPLAAAVPVSYDGTTYGLPTCMPRHSLLAVLLLTAFGSFFLFLVVLVIAMLVSVFIRLRSGLGRCLRDGDGGKSRSQD